MDVTETTLVEFLVDMMLLADGHLQLRKLPRLSPRMQLAMPDVTNLYRFWNIVNKLPYDIKVILALRHFGQGGDIISKVKLRAALQKHPSIPPIRIWNPVPPAPISHEEELAYEAPPRGSVVNWVDPDTQDEPPISLPFITYLSVQSDSWVSLERANLVSIDEYPPAVSTYP